MSEASIKNTASGHRPAGPVRRGLRIPIPSGPVLGLLALLAMFVSLLWYRGQLLRYFTHDNLQLLFHDNSANAVLALGMLLIMISGGIDLSVGSVLVLVTVATVQVYRMVYLGPEVVLPASITEPLRSAGLSWRATHSTFWASLFAIPVGLVTGGLCGLVNGLIITRLKLSPFVATLGMMSLARGLAILLAERRQFDIPGVAPDWVKALQIKDHPWLYFDPGVWSLFALAIAVFVLLRFTVYGRHLYAVGSNEATARLCGVAVGRVKVWTYALAGLLAGWAGVLLFAQANGCNPSSNAGRELEVIAAVVIGGASLSGGQGTVSGALLGVLIWGVMTNGLGYIDIPPEVKFLLMGAIVILNTAVSRWQRTQSA